MSSTRDSQYLDPSSHSLVFRVMRLCRPAMHPDLLLRSALPDLFFPEDAQEESFLAKSSAATPPATSTASPATAAAGGASGAAGSGASAPQAGSSLAGDAAASGAGPGIEDSAGSDAPGSAAAGGSMAASSKSEAPATQLGVPAGGHGKANREGDTAGPPSGAGAGAGAEGETGAATTSLTPTTSTGDAASAAGSGPPQSQPSQQQSGSGGGSMSVSVSGEEYFKARVELSDPLDSLGLAGMLVLPQSFGSIHLGETFCSYISVGNHANHDVSNVVIKAELQTERHRVVLVDGTTSPLERIQAGGRHDFIIEHDIKELGAHTLVCSASYIDFGEAKFLPQYFKFVASNPLSVKTKVRAVKEHTFMEASIENCGKLGLFLGRVRFEPVAPWRVTELKPEDDSGAGAEEDLEDDLCFDDEDSQGEVEGGVAGRGSEQGAEEVGASGGGGPGEGGMRENKEEAGKEGGAQSEGVGQQSGGSEGHGGRSGGSWKGPGGRSRRQALVDKDSAYSAVFRKAQVLAPSGGTQHFLYLLTKAPPPGSSSTTSTSASSNPSSGMRKSASSGRGSSEGTGTSPSGKGGGAGTEEKSTSQQQQLHEGGGTLGRLEISWRSTLGEPGRLQTQQILGNPAPWKEIEVKLKTLPSKVYLERPFLVDCLLVNHTDRTIGPLKIVIARDDPGSTGSSSSGVSSRAIVASGPWAMTVAPLEAHATHEFQLCLVALATGVQRLFGVGVVDARDSKPYDALPPTDLLVES